jgi:hypothetical protein
MTVALLVNEMHKRMHYNIKIIILDKTDAAVNLLNDFTAVTYNCRINGSKMNNSKV